MGIRYKTFCYTSLPIIKKHITIALYNHISLKTGLVFQKASLIPLAYKPFKYSVYKGNIFTSIKMDKFFVGQRFGTLVFTRKPHAFSKKVKAKKNILKR